ncbi:MAG TPA: QueT transporter family protein [Bacillota bacterium]|nr:QueT transporter family protein [Bacillota bacterium]
MKLTKKARPDMINSPDAKESTEKTASAFVQKRKAPAVRVGAKTVLICRAAIIAALYVVLTYLSDIFGLASGAIQLRLSEALCVLPYFSFIAVPGLTIGCLISNILFGVSFYDVIFGTLATAIGAVVSYYIRKYKYVVPLPTVVANAIIVPLVLRISGMSGDGFIYLMLTVGAGELLACCALGIPLMLVLEKYRSRIFDDNIIK